MKFCLPVFQNGTSSCGKSKSVKIIFFSLKMFSRVFSVSSIIPLAGFKVGQFYFVKLVHFYHTLLVQYKHTFLFLSDS